MLRLHLLGPPLIEQGDSLDSFKSRKIEALLYYLTLLPGKHHRSHLATLLWSELPEDKALSNLRYALWNLRKVLGEVPFNAERMTITSQPDGLIWSDVNEFRAALEKIEANDALSETQTISTLQQAADLYRGNFLVGFELSDAPFFEEWLQQQRAALHALAVSALTRLAHYHTTRNQLSQAIVVTGRLLELEPWQEATHRQMITLLALAGRRGAALEHYQKCRQLLAEELGLEPEPETTALIERIQAGQLVLKPHESAPRIPEMNSPSMPLYGRQAECAWLLDRWQKASRGQGQLVLLRGEAGVGKTRLVEEISRSALVGGAWLLSGRCYEFSGTVPYQPIAMALQKQISQIAALHLSLSDIWLAELSQLLPEIREHYPDLPAPLSSGQGADRYRLFEAVNRFLKAMTATQPVLLFLDDLHWADADTLDMVGYLVRNLAESPLLMIGSHRPDVVLNDHPLFTLRQMLLDEALLEELHLSPLGKEAIAEIVGTLPQSVADPHRLALFLTQISEGNPFILFETLRELEEQGWPRSATTNNWSASKGPLGQEVLIPVKVQTRIRRRIARLPTQSQQLLSIAAVIGREFEVDLLQAASQAPLEVILDCLDNWLARHLIREIANPDQPPEPAGYYRYDFSHDLIRAVVYDELSKARRRSLHGRVGQALEQLYAGQEEKVIERLAHHFHLAFESDKALLYLQQAGQQAQTVYALPIALACFEQALAHWEHLYNPAGHTTPPDVLRQRWNLFLNQARIYHMLGHQEKQRLALNTVAHEVVNWGDKQDQLQIIVQQLVYLRKTIELSHRRLAAREGLGLARLLGNDSAEGHTLQALGNCDRDIGQYEQALEHYEAALEKFSRIGRTRQAAFCLINMGGTHLMNNRFNQALLGFKEAERYARAGTHQDALIWSMIGVAYSCLMFGSLEKAQVINQEALDLCDRTGFQRAMSAGLIIQGNLSDVLRDNGQQA
ncbi:MAG: AAA family ATPase, partial [Anaerolineales bacterium]|nr:AAA family ATPase [Anaerolineales bacterium]